METEFPFKTEESQDNGIRLGGAWRNFSERIQVLEAEKAALTEQLGNITEDRDSLLVERKDMQIRFHDSVSSLTEEFSGHMRYSCDHDSFPCDVPIHSLTTALLPSLA